MSRTAVRSVACPECRAWAGNHCWSRGGKYRESNHAGRVDAYKAALHAGRDPLAELRAARNRPEPT